MTAAHGRAYREILACQAANPEAGLRPGTFKGLDSQEAAVLAHGYRASLARKGQTPPPEPILLVAPSAHQSRSGDYMPPASVPPER
jgi:hypothetical protein